MERRLGSFFVGFDRHLDVVGRVVGEQMRVRRRVVACRRRCDCCRRRRRARWHLRGGWLLDSWRLRAARRRLLLLLLLPLLGFLRFREARFSWRRCAARSRFARARCRRSSSGGGGGGARRTAAMMLMRVVSGGGGVRSAELPVRRMRWLVFESAGVVIGDYESGRHA